MNTEIIETIQKLDKIGKSGPTLFQKGGHVAQVQVPATADEQYSTSTSGIYSVTGSEGSNSPEYNTFRNRVTSDSRNISSRKRLSTGLSENKDHIARLTLSEKSPSCLSRSDLVNDIYNVDIVPHKPSRQLQGQGMNRQDLHEKYGKDVTVSTIQSCEKPVQKVERSNSRVNKVSNLIRWPKKQEKDKNGLSLSNSSQV